MYGLKLWYEFMDTENNLNRIEVRDKSLPNDSGAIEVRGLTAPFTVEYPTFDIMKPVRGSGATMRFLYKGPEAFMRNLFTTDPNRFKVVHKRCGVINWAGYLNSEIYYEDYSSDGQTLGIEYELTANDGFGILEHIPFNKIGSSVLDTVKVIREICELGKLQHTQLFMSMPFKFINSSAIWGGGIPDPWTGLKFQRNNFVDEDGEVMNCMEVLEGVLRPLGMSITGHHQSLYINTVDIIARGDQAGVVGYRVYNIATGAFIKDQAIGVNFNVVGGSDYYQTGQQLRYAPGINKQVLAVDTYPQENVITNVINNIELLYGSISNVYHTDDPEFVYTLKKYSNHEHWHSYASAATSGESSFAQVTGGENHKYERNERTVVLLASNNKNMTSISEGEGTINRPNTVKFKTKPIDTNLITSIDNAKIYLDIEAQLQCIEGEYLNPDTALSGDYRGFELGGYLRCNSHYLKGEIIKVDESSDNARCKIILSWTTIPSTFPIIFTKALDAGDDVYVSDKWVKCYNYGIQGIWETSDKYKNKFNETSSPLEIPLPPDMKSHKPCTIEMGLSDYYMHSYMHYRDDYPRLYKHKHIERDMWGYMVKDMVLTVKEVDDEKIEYTALSTNGFINEGGKIDTILGTADGDITIQRGAYFGYANNAYTPITTRDSKMFVNPNGLLTSIEGILLDSIMANSGKDQPVISASLKYPKFNIMQLAGFGDFPGQRFLCTSAVINYQTLQIDGTWRKINNF